MNNTIFGAAELVKKSASQIKYERDHKVEKKVSEAMISGVEYQNSIADKIYNAEQELRCEYHKDNITIYFCNDIVTSRMIIEVKQVNGVPEDWYLSQSILQTAFYKSMIMLQENNYAKLVTPDFMINNGAELKSVYVRKDINYYLLFGTSLYKILIDKPQIIADFYAEKAKIIANGDWKKIKEYDAIFKRKEFIYLSPFIRYCVSSFESLNLKAD